MNKVVKVLREYRKMYVYVIRKREGVEEKNNVNDEMKRKKSGIPNNLTFDIISV